MAKPRPRTAQAARRAMLRAQLGVSLGLGLAYAVAGAVVGHADVVALAAGVAILGVCLVAISALVSARQLAALSSALTTQLVGMCVKAGCLLVFVIIADALAWPRDMAGVGAILLLVAQAVAAAVAIHRTRVSLLDSTETSGT
ncbi:hypothetical protein H8R18_02585 [Nanchangia anserum]|uniref:Uncharacterized protein n=1 Tax=Nanchangia anserum TaxID=2692125 RepID=A0A8I0GA30_9ACTO|nr:hypothetical protein [Nanchangia anserum]MBD3689939.1 hypothetical protein [Nanchangia anserum]QOX82249.1 hypothetical protein H8R18_02585 [Nanchangia anserum]